MPPRPSRRCGRAGVDLAPCGLPTRRRAASTPVLAAQRRPHSSSRYAPKCAQVPAYGAFGCFVLPAALPPLSATPSLVTEMSRSSVRFEPPTLTLVNADSTFSLHDLRKLTTS